MKNAEERYIFVLTLQNLLLSNRKHDLLSIENSSYTAKLRYQFATQPNILYANYRYIIHRTYTNLTLKTNIEKQCISKVRHCFVF